MLYRINRSYSPVKGHGWQKGFVTLFISLLLPIVVIAQHKEAIQLQQQITNAVAKARPACVRIWVYDTLLHQRNSAQFSGVVVKDGYILTAAHVVTPTSTYRVMFPDGSDCVAVALGKIELSEDKTRPDVALMKIVTQGNWPFAEIGRSESLQPHAACISIAYPESLNLDKPTVRLGVVTDPLNDRGFIKSSCIMEPGDSGGPLFNIDGHVIGIHSAIEVSEKNNYDVPVNVYMKHWQALLTATTYHALPPQNALKSAIIPKFKTYPVLKPEDIAAFKTTDQIQAIVAIESRADNKVRRILGTVISLHGTNLEKTMGTSVIISKSSMVDDSVMVISSSEKRVRAKVDFRDKTNDLVLLHPSSPISGGITFKQFDANIMAAMTPGAFLISPQVDTATAVSILGSADTELPKVSSAGFSGATAAKSSKPAKIYFVRPGSPAALAGIKAGDVVNQVGLTHIDSATAYATAMSTYWPGDTLSLHIKRENQDLHFALLLTYPPLTTSSHPAEYFAGGKSKRRDGFTHVYTNDAVLKPEQCGGPVFNLKGEICGIQIARYSRANSLLLPAETLRAFINTAYGNAKMEHQSNRPAK